MSLDDDPFADLGAEDGSGAPVADLPPEVAQAVAACAGLELNDLGNAQRFATHFGADLLHAGQLGWHDWDGRRWRADEEVARDLSPAVRARAHRLGPLIAAECAHVLPAPADRPLLAEHARLMGDLAQLETVPADQRDAGFTARLLDVRRQLGALEAGLKPYRDRIKRRLAHARAAGNSAPMANFVRESSVLLACEHTDLDVDPMAVNTLSGILRFSVDKADGKTPIARVVLEPHDRGQRMTKLMPVDYLEFAPCPQFDAFLEEIQPDRAMRKFLLRWLGASMLGIQMQAVAFFYGQGNNGKSVVVDTVARIYGDYAASIPIKSLTGDDRRGGGDATPDLMGLVGARFLRASEPARGVKLQEALIKEMTGGEPMMVRSLLKNFITIRPFFKLSITMNDKPEITGTDFGIWRRLIMVPFDVRIPDERVERGLADRLVREEGAGIFARLVEGALDFLEIGLDPPDRVVEANRSYREQSDPLGQFVTGCCEVTGNADNRISAADLIDAFAFWMSANRQGNWTEATMAKRFASMAGQWACPTTGHRFTRAKSGGVWRYQGLRFQEGFRKAFTDAPRDVKGRVLKAEIEMGE